MTIEVEDTYKGRGQQIEELAHHVGLDVPTELTLSSGVVVKPKTLPPGMLTRLYQMQRKGRPGVPKLEVKDEEKGKTYTVDNPDDPAYLQALADFNTDFSLRVLDLMLTFGLEVVSVPQGVAPMDSDDWMEYFDIMGEPRPDTPTGRRLAWLNTVAVASTDDIERIREIAMPSTVVSPEDVKEAEAGF